MVDKFLEKKNIISTRSNNDHVKDEETYGYATQIITSCALPMVLHAAFDMGVLRLVNEAGTDGLSAAEITVRLDIQNPDAPAMLDRMLRLLATYSVVSCRTVPTTDDGVERRYGPAPVTRHFVADEDGISMGPSLSLVNDLVFLKSWSKLKDAVVEGGIPFNKVHGMHAFEYPSVDPRFNDIFNKAMYNQSTEVMKKILEKYKGFEHIQQLIDVGGGLGHVLSIITSKYRSIKGINFDLPHVVKNAPAIHGVEHVGGDMFESVPRGDAIFMKWILHDWSDDHCLKLLKNCYKALPENGKVIVVEITITDEPEKTVYGRATSQIDVLMMTQHIGGKERTLKEFEALAMAAGFSGFKADSSAYHYWAMEFYK